MITIIESLPKVGSQSEKIEQANINFTDGLMAAQNMDEHNSYSYRLSFLKQVNDNKPVNK